ADACLGDRGTWPDLQEEHPSPVRIAADVLEIGEIDGSQQCVGAVLAALAILGHLTIEGEVVLLRHCRDEVPLVLEVVVEAGQRNAGEPRDIGERGLADALPPEQAGCCSDDLLATLLTALLLELQRSAHGSLTESSSPPWWESSTERNPLAGSRTKAVY